jgi:hypothetical protein
MPIQYQLHDVRVPGERCKKAATKPSVAHSLGCGSDPRKASTRALQRGRGHASLFRTSRAMWLKKTPAVCRAVRPFLERASTHASEPGRSSR